MRQILEAPYVVGTTDKIRVRGALSKPAAPDPVGVRVLSSTDGRLYLVHATPSQPCSRPMSLHSSPPVRSTSSVAALIAVLLVAGTLLGCESSDQPTGPNVVVIYADDMGYGDPGAYNASSRIPTPNIDRLASEGRLFTDAHSTSSVCTPSRYSLLTGRYSWRTRLTSGVLLGYGASLIDTGRTTVASMLDGLGYRTGGVGKWHLGLQDEQPTDYAEPLRPGPVSLGFDYYWGIPASLDFEPYLYFENDETVELPTDSTVGNSECCLGPFWRAGAMAPSFVHEEVLPRITDHAVRFVRESAEGEEPFFLYLPYSAPHTPWLPTGEFEGRSQAGQYGDFVAQVDASVGAVLQALDETGAAENTLVVFTSDNGAIWPPEQVEEFDHRANYRWRGMKADIWEGGHRVPFIARWPDEIPPGTSSDATISQVDLLRTIAAAVGAELPPEAGPDSYNVLPAMTGESYAEPVRGPTVQHSSRGMFALRSGPWKLIEGRGSGGFTEPVEIEPEEDEPEGQLYNLADDPDESDNLYQQRPELVDSLQAVLDRYRSQGYTRPRR